MKSTFHHTGKPDHKLRGWGSAYMVTVSQPDGKLRRGGKVIKAATSAGHLSPLTHGPTPPRDKPPGTSKVGTASRDIKHLVREHLSEEREVRAEPTARTGPRHTSSPGEKRRDGASTNTDRPAAVPPATKWPPHPLNSSCAIPRCYWLAQDI